MTNNAIIQTIPAANGLHKVPGFDPLKYLRRAVNAQGEPVLRLELSYKKLWFRLACPNGRMLLNPLRITDQMSIIEAQVFFDRGDAAPASSFTATKAAKESPLTAAQQPRETPAPVQAAPVQEAADAPAAPKYTAEMPVEEICEKMTPDEARAVVVPTGTCKGLTLAQVAERRRSSLRYS